MSSRPVGVDYSSPMEGLAAGPLLIGHSVREYARRDSADSSLHCRDQLALEFEWFATVLLRRRGRGRNVVVSRQHPMHDRNRLARCDVKLDVGTQCEWQHVRRF